MDAHADPHNPDYSDGYQDYFLHDVAVAGGRAWVVGDLQAYHIDRALVERWNGTRWSTVSVPLDSGSSGYCNARPLATVSAVGAANVWAFGRCWDEFQHTYTTEATALHLAGGVWSWVTLPAPENAQAVVGIGAGRVIDDVTGETVSGPDSLALLGP